MHAEQDQLKETFLSTFFPFVPEDGFALMPDGGYRTQSTRMLFFGWRAALDSQYPVREHNLTFQYLEQGHLLLPRTPTALMLAAYNLAGVPNPRDRVCHSELFRRAFENSEALKFREEAQAFLTTKDLASQGNSDRTEDFKYAFTGWQVARADLNPDFVTVSEWITSDTVGLRDNPHAGAAFTRVLKDYTRKMIVSRKV